MGATVAVILIRERHVAEAFVNAGATSADRRRTPQELNVDPEGVGFRRLRERAVLRDGGMSDGKYYIDVEVWQAVGRMRRRIVLVVVLVVGAFLLYMVLGSHK
jgi:hypothetical protein